jgi:hypothetical protein
MSNWITYTKTESTTIREAFRAFWHTIDHTRQARDIERAVATARRDMGTGTTIRHHEAIVMKAWLEAFKAPRSFTAVGMHGLAPWWQTAVMAGASFRELHHDRDRAMVDSFDPACDVEWQQQRHASTVRALKRAAKARRKMREAVAAHEGAWDRHFAKMQSRLSRLNDASV